MGRARAHLRQRVLGAAIGVVLALAAISCNSSDNVTGTNASDTPTVPVTPDIADPPSQIVNGAREFHVTASVFKRQIATFPYKTAEVGGYNGSTPGPTAVAYEGEKIRFVFTNNLPEATTVHFHGMHQPNDMDGVAGVDQTPIQPGATFTYEFTPGIRASSPTTRTPTTASRS